MYPINSLIITRKKMNKKMNKKKKTIKYINKKQKGGCGRRRR